MAGNNDELTQLKISTRRNRLYALGILENKLNLYKKKTGKSISIYEFSKAFDSNKTSDKLINKLLVSEINSEIYVVLEKSINIWCLKTGIMLRRYEKLVESKILSVALDKLHKIFFVALENGQIM